MLAIPPFGRAGNSPYRANSKPPVELGVGDFILLDQYGYPPVTIDDVYKEVLEQAENFKKYAK